MATALPFWLAGTRLLCHCSQPPHILMDKSPSYFATIETSILPYFVKSTIMFWDPKEQRTSGLRLWLDNLLKKSFSLKMVLLFHPLCTPVPIAIWNMSILHFYTGTVWPCLQILAKWFSFRHTWYFCPQAEHSLDLLSYTASAVLHALETVCTLCMELRLRVDQSYMLDFCS